MNGENKLFSKNQSSSSYDPNCFLNGTAFSSETLVQAGNQMAIKCTKTGESSTGDITIVYDDFAKMERIAVIEIRDRT